MKRGGAIKLMRSAAKMERKSTTQACTSCGEMYTANPIQIKCWDGKCYECFIKDN